MRTLKVLRKIFFNLFNFIILILLATGLHYMLSAMGIHWIIRGVVVALLFYYIFSLIRKQLKINHQDAVVCDLMNKQLYNINLVIKSWRANELKTYDAMKEILAVCEDEVTS